MPSLTTALITYLKTIGNITGVIGTGTAAKIHKMRIPQDQPAPYIRLEMFEGESEETLTDIAGITSNRVQIDAYNTTSEGAYDLAEFIRLAPLQMLRTSNMGGLDVLNVTSDQSYREDEDPPPKGSQQRRFFCSRDYIFTYREATS